MRRPNIRVARTWLEKANKLACFSYAGTMHDHERLAKIQTLRECAKAILASEYELCTRCENGQVCYSHSGHFYHCPLLNKPSAEVESLLAGEYTEYDRKLAHVLGVAL
jgi:hypothetical protein